MVWLLNFAGRTSGMITDSIISALVPTAAKAAIRHWKVAIALGLLVAIVQMVRKHRADDSDQKTVGGSLDRPEMEDALA